MSREHRHLLLCWLALLALAAIACGVSFVPFHRSWRPLLMLPALGMVALVALMFMGIRAAPSIARGFAVAALFWLTILLALGMMDPLTRAIFTTGQPTDWEVLRQISTQRPYPPTTR